VLDNFIAVLDGTVQPQLSAEDDEPRTYSNLVSVIQSFGCGKSQMVDEVAKRRITFPLNLRGPSGLGEGKSPSFT
jgi:hypothetical protein